MIILMIYINELVLYIKCTPFEKDKFISRPVVVSLARTSLACRIYTIPADL